MRRLTKNIMSEYFFHSLMNRLDALSVIPLLSLQRVAIHGNPFTLNLIT